MLVHESLSKRHVPIATYRLQFNAGFTLRDALAIVPYLHDLGISDCYASPLFQARSGSTHGYDVCDPTRLNPELGSDEDFDAFTGALADRGMGLILDVVPNHMGISDPANTWWMDVLENGPSSIYAPCFDIDWEPVNPALFQKVLLPVLGDQFGNVLEAGQFRVALEQGAFFVHYYDRRFPLSPNAYIPILEQLLARLSDKLKPNHLHVAELQSIVTALAHLPPRDETAPEKIEERHREKEVVKRRLAALCESDPFVSESLNETLRTINGIPGDARSFDALEGLLREQPYRLAYWRVATEEINYRRFFDIDDLAAVRTENPLVFQATHQLVVRWLGEGKVRGLRVDHPDGLWDPEEYFRRLQTMFVAARVRARFDPAHMPEEIDEAVADLLEKARAGAKGGRIRWPLYVVAEKILCEDEPLPGAWAVDGTTGYDFLNLVNGLFVDADAEMELDKLYNHFAGGRLAYPSLVRNSKKMIMLVSMAGEINALAHQLDRISEQNRRYRDFTLNSLTFAIREVIACLNVYRSYVTQRQQVTAQDRRFVTDAVATAKRLNPRTAATIFDFIRDTLLLDNLHQFREEDQPQVLAWTMKFQQVSGPIMAKGVEDTAFYVFNRLVSLNEVGGHPNRFGVSLEEFHHANRARASEWPSSMLASSTHDTKRSEDVRARLNVLSEIADDWRDAATRWSVMNTPKKSFIDGEPAPDANDEYLLYQTLIGAWPEGKLDGEAFRAFRDRILTYMDKATREAKVHTSWVNPSDAYDSALRDFILRLLPDDPNDEFLADLAPIRERVAYFGRFNALAQTLLKLTCPGVPDLYQGTELWSLHLVDPDNRQPVDFAHRRTILARLDARLSAKDDRRSAVAADLLTRIHDGALKLYLIQQVLRFRREHRDLFEWGDHVPLEATGPKADHVCAFLRVLGDAAILVAVPRWTARLAGGRLTPPLGSKIWGDAAIVVPSEVDFTCARDLFTGETLASGPKGAPNTLHLSVLFDHLPFALVPLQISPRDADPSPPPVSPAAM